MSNINNKISENQITIIKADKGNTTVIIPTTEYNEKILQYIQDNNIMELQLDPTETYKVLINSSINRNNKVIDMRNRFRLKMIKPEAPQLRGLPKLHKEGTPMRPLVNYTTAPSYKLSKFINKYLNQKLTITNTSSIKKNIELVNNIKNINIPNNGKLASFDITNMYGNIPVNETLQILKKLLHNNKMDNTEIEQIMDIIQTITSQNYFHFNGKYFIQIEGLPMGNPLSGTLAEIFINNFEQTYIFNTVNKWKKNIAYWHRYVDDILILFNGTQRQLNNLHNYINNIHRNIKFTLETEVNNHINFLDITIKKENNKHNFKIYRKHTQTDHTIHYTSNHPQQHKMAAYQHMINRMNIIPMNENDYKEELNIIKYIAKANGFCCTMIDNINRKYKYKEELRSRTTLIPVKEEYKKFITIEYSPHTMKLIHKTFRQHEYNIAYKTTNKIENRVNTNKTITECESGVYQLKCNDCTSFYIGQTGRSFQTRFKEHTQEIGKHNIKSNYAQHLTHRQHSYNNYNENLNVICRMRKGENLDRAEEMEIYKQKDNPLLLNDKMPHNAIYQYIKDNLL